MENYLLLIVGILLSVLGAVNIKGNIRTIHAYNRRNVREEDIPKYGRAVGTGTLIIGVSLAAAFFVSLRNEAAVSFIVLPGLAVGLASSTITGFFDPSHWKRKRTVFPSSFATDCQKSLAEFAPAGANKVLIIFSGDMCVGENTFRLANVRA